MLGGEAMPLATTIDGSATVSLDAIDPGAVGGLSQAEAEDRLATPRSTACS
jgi:hypothetical protein